MSKAFTREENEGPDRPDLPERESALPEGARNYLTPEGAARLREELACLIATDRPPLLDASADPDAKRQLARVNERIFQIEQSLESAEILAAEPNADRVTFGATVRVRDDDGEESVYRIVGVDETDFDRGRISWTSPLARALLQKRVGDIFSFETPGGERRLEILQIGDAI